MPGTNVVGTKTMLAENSGFQYPEQLHNENLGLPICPRSSYLESGQDSLHFS